MEWSTTMGDFGGEFGYHRIHHPELSSGFLEEQLDQLRQQMSKQNREALHEKQGLIHQNHQVSIAQCSLSINCCAPCQMQAAHTRNVAKLKHQVVTPRSNPTDQICVPQMAAEIRIEHKRASRLESQNAMCLLGAGTAATLSVPIRVGFRRAVTL